MNIHSSTKDLALIKRSTIFIFIVLLIYLSSAQDVQINLLNISKTQSNSLIDSTKINEIEYYLQRSMPDAAIPIIIDYLSISNIFNNQKNYIQVLLAEAYRQKREYNKGIDLLYLLISQPNIDNEPLIYAHTRLAAIYHECGFPNINTKDSAMKYSEIALDLAQQSNMEKYIAAACNEIGLIEIENQNFDDAENYLNKALNIFHENKMYLHSANVVINLSILYIASKRYQEAGVILESAINSLDPSTDKNMLMRLYQQEAKMNKQMGNLEEALFAQEQVNKIQNSFFTERIDKQIMELSALYDLELKENQINEERLKQKEQKRKIVLLIVLSGILVVIIIASILFFRLNRKYLMQKQDNIRIKHMLLEKEYSIKNKELTNALTNTVSLNNILESVKKEIKEHNFNEAINIINANQSSNKIWYDFLNEFNKQQPDFIVKLKQRHPNLTENEIKLCAFLKMHLKSREIADILGIQESSVNKMRQRLRKKLQLEQQACITHYLENI